MKRARGSYEGLTAKQAELLSFLRNERDAGRTPSFEEMKVATGLASKSGVNRLLLGLVERGYVDRTLNRARAIRVYDVASIARTADPLVNIDLTAIPMTALLGEIARRTNGQVRI